VNVRFDLEGLNQVNVYYENKHFQSANVDYIALCQIAFSSGDDIYFWAIFGYAVCLRVSLFCLYPVVLGRVYDCVRRHRQRQPVNCQTEQTDRPGELQGQTVASLAGTASYYTSSKKVCLCFTNSGYFRPLVA